MQVPYSPIILKNVLRLVLQKFLYLEAFVCHTTLANQQLCYIQIHKIWRKRQRIFLRIVEYRPWVLVFLSTCTQTIETTFLVPRPGISASDIQDLDRSSALPISFQGLIIYVTGFTLFFIVDHCISDGYDTKHAVAWKET